MNEAPSFPPLMWGEEVREDALGHAARKATLGCDAGLVSYVLGPTHVEAALVFAPEVPLSEAMVMLPLCGVGFQNALGAIAPPEVAVQLTWDGEILVNGAGCGSLQAQSSGQAPDEIPDWLVVGFQVRLIPDSDEMGHTPDKTALYAEGCAEVAPPLLVEAFSRHTLNWINRWEGDGVRPLHTEWRGLATGIGEPAKVGDTEGTFLGIDENFGMLLRREDGETQLFPLTTLLED